MIAVFVLVQGIGFIETILGASLDHPAHIDANNTGEFIETIEPVIRFVIDQARVSFSPAIFLAPPFQNEFVNSAQLHEKILFDGGI